MNRRIMQLTDWTFKACDDEEWLAAKVPGTVHTDLLRHGRIPHPFKGTNEHRLQWMDKKDWEYEAHFEVEETLLAMSNLELVFEGLDTYADIEVNGVRVLSTNNMFLRWVVDVKPYLKPSHNTLQVRFRSPISEDMPKVEKRGYNFPAANDQSELGEIGEHHLSVYARKAPYHYGWDWGPRFVTSGIWRDVYLQGWNGARIQDLYVEQVRVTQEQANLAAHLEIESEVACDGVILLSNGEQVWESKVSLLPGINARSLSIVISQPKLWWSRGLGEAHRYSFTAQLVVEGNTVARSEVKVGLRQIRLVREEDSYGTSFYFELNGVPVFAKGANHIPNDSFLPDITEERYRYEVKTAVASNMNMLRVWGGGIYEPDLFYDLCDEHGILVWQDFLFACSMYPGDEAFLQNVRLEAEYNVKRLRNHACIALWCGNNEIDVAWGHYDEKLGWGWKQNYTQAQREEMWTAYERIFHQLLPEVVAAYAPHTDYWASSPMEDITGDASQHARYSSTRGDMHYWGVWHALEPIENYNVTIGRFMSEYGFQSFPERKTVEAYAESSDMDLMSEVMKAHQKTGSGNDKMRTYMERYLRLPTDFYGFIYMSQIMQAEAMKAAIEAHRRHRPLCMGTLYWQLNDCWPVASWSGVDYYGRWKAMQFFAKKGFKDVMLSIDGTSHTQADLYICSDALSTFHGELEWSLYHFDGECLRVEKRQVTGEANASTKLLTLVYKEWLEGMDPAQVVLKARLLSNSEIVDEQLHYMLPATELALMKPQITITEVEGAERATFTLMTDVLAKYVWLEHEVEGYMSDNYFDLIPGIPYEVAFQPRDSQAAALGKEQITIHSMTDYC